jgi:type III pantothenate kinase
LSDIFLFDIGNSRIKLGISSGEEVRMVSSTSTPESREPGVLAGWLREACRGVQVEACVACTVAPDMEAILCRACAEVMPGAPVLFVGKELELPIESLYARPEELGPDRLVSAFAARELYPITRGGAHIVAGFGTATTFDCVSHGAYAGGLICPGVGSSGEALAGMTARLSLPDLEAVPDTPAIGRTTAECLGQGFVMGFAAMAEGVCSRLRAMLPEPVVIVATGGHGKRISRAATCFDHVSPDLVLEGLRLAYQRAHFKNSTSPQGAGK